jgi:hypothetical protein
MKHKVKTISKDDKCDYRATRSKASHWDPRSVAPTQDGYGLGRDSSQMGPGKMFHAISGFEIVLSPLIRRFSVHNHHETNVRTIRWPQPGNALGKRTYRQVRKHS